MTDIYTQFINCKEVAKANALRDKYLNLVADNQKAKVYQLHRHAENRINRK